MIKPLIFVLMVIVSGCSWNAGTINTADYKLKSLDSDEAVEELRVFVSSDTRKSCATRTGKNESSALFTATVVGAAVKSVAAYGKEQADVAINYLKSDVKATGKTTLTETSFHEKSRLCVLLVYGIFNTPDKVSGNDFWNELNASLGEEPGKIQMLLTDYSSMNEKLVNPVNTLVGKPAFFAEFEISTIDGKPAPQTGKVIYTVKPDLLVYPHPLHKGVINWFDRNLSVEIAFGDVKAAVSFDKLKPKAIYKAKQMFTRTAVVEGKAPTNFSVLTATIIEGPDKAPTDKILGLAKDAIDAKVADYNANHKAE